MVVLFLLLALILSGLYEKPRRKKDWVSEKKYIEEFVWRTSFFLNWQPPFYVLLVAFFDYSPSQVTYLLNGPNKDRCCYAWYSVWYQKYENLLQFNTSCLAKNVILFQTFFSFSCSSCDLTLTIKRDTWNFYSF